MQSSHALSIRYANISSVTCSQPGISFSRCDKVNIGTRTEKKFTNSQEKTSAVICELLMRATPTKVTRFATCVFK